MSYHYHLTPSGSSGFVYGKNDNNFYNGAKRADGRIQITSGAFRPTSGRHDIGLALNLSSQEHAEVVIIHEALHYSGSGLLGPRGPGIHEDSYYFRVMQEFLNLHPDRILDAF